MSMRTQAEKRLLGTITGGTETVGSQTDPGEESSQRKRMEDMWIERIFGFSKDQLFNLFNHRLRAIFRFHRKDVWPSGAWSRKSARANREIDTKHHQCLAVGIF